MTLGIILLIPSMTLAENFEKDASEIRQGALAEAHGDSMQAFIILSLKTAEVLDGTNVLQADLKVCKRINQRYEDYYVDDRTWLERTWDSDVVKVGLFIGGIIVGTKIVKNVN